MTSRQYPKRYYTYIICFHLFNVFNTSYLHLIYVTSNPPLFITYMHSVQHLAQYNMFNTKLPHIFTLQNYFYKYLLMYHLIYVRVPLYRRNMDDRYLRSVPPAD